MRLAGLLLLSACAGTGVLTAEDCADVDSDDVIDDPIDDPVTDDPEDLRCGPEDLVVVASMSELWSTPAPTGPLLASLLPIDEASLPLPGPDPVTTAFTNCGAWADFLAEHGLADPLPELDFARFDLVLHQEITGRCTNHFVVQTGWEEPGRRVVSGRVLVQQPGPTDGDCIAEETELFLVEKSGDRPIYLEFAPTVIAYP
jgi:hypothetical protein